MAHKSEHERFEIAKRHVLNALDFKKLRMDLELPETSRTVKLVYDIQTNLQWKSFLHLMSYIYMYASFFGHVHPSRALLAIEFIMLSIYMIDMIMEVCHKCIRTRLSTSKLTFRFYFRVLTVTLLFIDSLIAASTE